ncbi:MAG: hypothetical protein ACYSW3_24560 [Planctomycetota bacterium]|jgi:uncharacterized alpha/beta hydrolase family protein
MSKFDNNARIYSIITLAVIFIAIIGIAIGYSNEIPDNMEEVEPIWAQSKYASGYRLIVITHHSGTDRSIKTENTYNVGKVGSKKIVIHKIDGDGIVNVCFQITAYGHVKGLYVESIRSDRFCMQPWPPRNLRPVQ